MPKCIMAFRSFLQRIQLHHLQWVVGKPTTCVNYLDITLSIKDGHVTSTLFEKSLHLYLYLPRASAHPPGVLKGLIAGGLLRIIQLTSNPTTNKQHVQQFYQRLLARSYTSSHLLPIFEKYITKYASITNPTPAPTPAPAHPLHQQMTKAKTQSSSTYLSILLTLLPWKYRSSSAHTYSKSNRLTPTDLSHSISSITPMVMTV